MFKKIKNQLMKPPKRTGAKLKGTVATFAAMCIVCMLFFCSCKKDVSNVNKDVIDTTVYIVIVNEALEDRLNPDSPSYFGDKFVNEIEVFYLCNGKKLPFLDYYKFIGGGSLFYIDDVENKKPISPPLRWTERYGYIDQGTLGYYFIDCSSGLAASVIEDNEKVTYTYIHYPDGSEDEIKVQYIEKDGLLLTGKIWIKGELAFESGAWGVKDFYYNTKYYPWLEPVLDNAGKQIGVSPKKGTKIVVITK